MEDAAELQRKLRVAEEEAESAKENLRVERAKMTREKKQWALDRKSEEKRWAEDMAQLSREKRIWAEERERLTASSAESGKSKWEQERRSLLEQHRIEIAALQAHKDSPHVGESGKCEKLAAEQARADDLERQLHLERAGAEARSQQLRELQGSQERAEEISRKAHLEAMSKSQSVAMSAQAKCKELQAALDAARTELEQLRENSFRKEHQEKANVLEDAWKGLLAGTHDAQLSYSTQRLSTGSTLLHVTCATVRHVGAGSTAGTSKPRPSESVSLQDRQRMTGISLRGPDHAPSPSLTSFRDTYDNNSGCSPATALPSPLHSDSFGRPQSGVGRRAPREQLGLGSAETQDTGAGLASASEALSLSLAEIWGSRGSGVFWRSD